MQLNKRDKEVITRIFHHINADFRNHTLIADIACEYGIALSTLTAGFKYLFGDTIYQHRLIVSMEYANAMIEEGKRIKDLQIELGYKTSGNFARAFRKVFGNQPTHIQKIPKLITKGAEKIKIIFWLLSFFCLIQTVI